MDETSHVCAEPNLAGFECSDAIARRIASKTRVYLAGKVSQRGMRRLAME